MVSQTSSAPAEVPIHASAELEASQNAGFLRVTSVDLRVSVVKIRAITRT